MRHILVIIVMTFMFFTLGLSQITIERQVISPWGIASLSGGLQMDATLGEVIIGTANGTLSLTQGFQQPLGNVTTGFAEYLGSEIEYQLYPNPFQQFITVDLSSTELSKGTLEVYTLHGAVLQRFDMDLHTGKITVDLSSLDNGLYAIRLSDKSYRTVFVHFIQKV